MPESNAEEEWCMHVSYVVHVGCPARMFSPVSLGVSARCRKRICWLHDLLFINHYCWLWIRHFRYGLFVSKLCDWNN